MLKQDRVERVLQKLREMNVDQMVITDPMAIFYLTGRMVWAGERFLAMMIGQDTKPVIFLNELFNVTEDLGLEQVYYTDTDPVMPLFDGRIGEGAVLGVDKAMEARFLLPLISSGKASRVVNSSIAVDRTRAIKDAAEIASMKKASKANDLALAEFKKLLHEGVTEKEVAAQTMAIYKSFGATGYSFPPIVSFGINSTDPHHMPDDTPLKEGDLVLFDVGCVVEDYCSDMTRTYFYKKEPNADQRRVYELVLRANMEAEAMLKPGIVIADIDKKARDIITEGGFGKFFTHRLGHFIGLQDHEFGDVSQANHSLTEAGNIFSIEPGIYDPATAGVRIEDLVLITEDGYENLNTLPKELEVIE